MAFNLYGYNPFQTSNGAYASHGRRAPQSGPVRFGTYGTTPYGYPRANYPQPTPYQPSRFAPQQGPQVIYMMPAPEPKQKWWDWKKFAFNAVSIAAGLGIAGIFSVLFLPKPFAIEMINQTEKNVKKRLGLQKNQSLIEEVCKQATPHVNRMVDNVVNTQARKAETLFRDLMGSVSDGAEGVFKTETSKLLSKLGAHKKEDPVERVFSIETWFAEAAIPLSVYLYPEIS